MRDELNTNPLGYGLSRRSLLKTALMSAMGTLMPGITMASVPRKSGENKSLSFHNPHTKENIDVVYWSDGKYLAAALEDINYLMRDIRTSAVKQIDTRLLDLLYQMRVTLDACEPFHIISGYRSRKSNNLLRKQGWAAAKNSLHTQGKAADIRLPGCRVSQIRRTAFKLRGGGVGYYPRLKFVHVDVGPVRYWTK